MATLNLEEVLVTETARAISTMFRDMGNIFQFVVPASVDSTDIQVPLFKRATDLSLVNTARASGADPQTIASKFYFESISLEDHSLVEKIDRQDIPRMNKLIGTAGYDFIINELIEALMNGIHNGVSDIISTAANFSDGNSIIDLSAGGHVQWSTVATAVPRADSNELKELYRAAQGAEPNYLVISRDVLDTLTITDDWIGYWDKIQMPETEEEQLKKYFSIPNVLLLGKYKGINGSFTNYYTQVFIYTYIEPPRSGELIGNIVANRSALRIYFLDQNSSNVENQDPSLINQWTAMNVDLPMLIKLWTKSDQYGLQRLIVSDAMYKVHVANKYALAKFTDIYV